MSQPLVTVNILTWNRKADLERLLISLKRQSYPDLEVIVVDNASTDGTSEMVKSKFPRVRLFRSGENRGIVNWNVGFENAAGKYILALDDDCFPEEDAIERMVSKFLQEPDIGIIAFRILDVETGKYWNSLYTPATDREMDWFTFAGCAAGFRADLIKEILFPDIFLYEHELEPSIRFIDRGYRIVLCPEIRAYHRLPKSRRQSWKGAYFGTRNDLLFACKFFPALISLRLSLGIVMVHGLVALKHRRLMAYLKGIFHAIKRLPSTVRSRTIVSEEAVQAFSPFLSSKKVFSRIRKNVRAGMQS